MIATRVKLRISEEYKIQPGVCMNMMKGLKKYRLNVAAQRGATTVEYAVIVAILILAIIATVIVLEENSSEIFNSVSEQVGNFSNLPSS